MAITVTHPKVSAIPDDPASVAAGEVVPSDWNANHTVVVDGLDNVPIGAGGASTGAFTTLSASSTVSGAGFSTYLASPPAIGGSTPSTGNFTTLDATTLEVTNLRARDGTSAGSIANTTGIVTLASSVLTTTDINGGTIDGASIGASSASTGAFTTLSASSLGLNGSSSGTVTVNTAAAAGTWTLTLPTSAGTNGYVLSTDGAGVTSWVAQSGGGVTSFSAGTTGLTPNTATTGAVTLAGTLAVANGGTGVTTSTGTGSVVLSNSPALGSIGIGTSAGTAIGAVIGGTLSGSTSGASIQAQPTIGSGITGEYTTYKSRPITQAATFTLANMVHFYAQPQAKGAGSTITAQYGFLADSGMTDATITYGFYSGIASGTNRFGVYMAGTAVNYFGGLVRIGSSSTGDQQLNVNGAVRVGGAITSANQTSAGTMDFNTASGQMRFLSWGASGTQGIFTWWTGTGAGGTTQRMTLNGSNNLGLATSTFGTSATNTFSVFTGTAPTTGVADTVQFYSSDLSAGNTIPSFYTEGTNVGTGTPTANRTIAVRFNGTVYYLLASTIP